MCGRTCTVSSKAGLYLKVGWAGRPPAEMPATHWEETPSMLAGADSSANKMHNSTRSREEGGNRCKAGAKSGGAPGDAVVIHLAEHTGVAHVHLRGACNVNG